MIEYDDVSLEEQQQALMRKASHVLSQKSKLVRRIQELERLLKVCQEVVSLDRVEMTYEPHMWDGWYLRGLDRVAPESFLTESQAVLWKGIEGRSVPVPDTESNLVDTSGVRLLKTGSIVCDRSGIVSVLKDDGLWYSPGKKSGKYLPRVESEWPVEVLVKR